MKAWIARNKNNTVALFFEKPFKRTNKWLETEWVANHHEKGYSSTGHIIPPNDPLGKDITFEGSPREIELIGNGADQDNLSGTANAFDLGILMQGARFFKSSDEEWMSIKQIDAILHLATKRNTTAPAQVFLICTDPSCEIA
jgi:hypothetical protein